MFGRLLRRPAHRIARPIVNHTPQRVQRMATASAGGSGGSGGVSGLSAGNARATGNAPASVLSKIGRNLHRTPQHPIQLIKAKVENYFASSYPHPASAGGRASYFRSFDELSPVVTTKQNFDDLLVPVNHISRSLSDTFYLDANRVLRTHTSAHQNDLLRAGERAFLVSGDCYRRDEIDATHYPTFHQMEGVRIWAADGSDARVAPTPGLTLPAAGAGVSTEFVISDLKRTLEGLVRHVFGPATEMRWIDAYFPFTEPSLELEIFFGGKWLEVLGSGAIHPRLLAGCGLSAYRGWAFGIGLERLAMVLYDIPDIRLFWSDDPRFIKQFANESATAARATTPLKFKPFSNYSPVTKDVSFWLPPGRSAAAKDSSPTSTGLAATASTVPTAAAIADAASSAGGASFHDNDLYSVVRDVAGDLVESVSLVDAFTHPKTKLESRCYRITYRHLSRMLTNAEIDVMQNTVRERLAARTDLKLR